MYIKVKVKTQIQKAAREIQKVSTLETCGIPELVKLYNENWQVRLWFDSWIKQPAEKIEKLLDEDE